MSRLCVLALLLLGCSTDCLETSVTYNRHSGRTKWLVCESRQQHQVKEEDGDTITVFCRCPTQ